jgi:CubicO group peptidase (beta-lactamase class C family)
MFVGVQPILADSLDDYVQKQMTARHIPGAVLIVLKDGKILKQGAYGFSNAELDTPMRADNVFPVASITKIFVTTAAFLLVQDGKLNLNDKITELLPGLPDTWRGITVLNCLSHTSGIPDIVKYRTGGFQWLASTQEEALSLLSSMPLEYRPGDKSGYNGTDFLVMKMIVERTSGMSLPEFLAKRIFEPLGLKSARYGDTIDVISGRVSLYTTYTPSVDRTFAFDQWDSLVESKDKIWNYRVPYPTWLYGAAGLNISATDIAKFDAALLSGRLLTKKSLDQMWTVFLLTNGEPSRFTAGWMYRTWQGHKLVFHLGGDFVEYAHVPDTGVSIIWLTNLDPSDPYDVVSGILEQTAHP